MHQGRLVFYQLMAYLPMITFRRCVAKHHGDHKIKDLSCLDQLFTIAFAQLTYRESLRDIEVSLRAQANRLHHMDFHCSTISRNTLANANATRPWQMYADFAQHLLGIARPLYAKETVPHTSPMPMPIEQWVTYCNWFCFNQSCPEWYSARPADLEERKSRIDQSQSAIEASKRHVDGHQNTGHR